MIWPGRTCASSISGVILDHFVLSCLSLLQLAWTLNCIRNCKTGVFYLLPAPQEVGWSEHHKHWSDVSVHCHSTCSGSISTSRLLSSFLIFLVLFETVLCFQTLLLFFLIRSLVCRDSEPLYLAIKTFLVWTEELCTNSPCWPDAGSLLNPSCSQWFINAFKVKLERTWIVFYSRTME